jgi:hypothetical protein
VSDSQYYLQSIRIELTIALQMCADGGWRYRPGLLEERRCEACASEKMFSGLPEAVSHNCLTLQSYTTDRSYFERIYSADCRKYGKTRVAFGVLEGKDIQRKADDIAAKHRVFLKRKAGRNVAVPAVVASSEE